MEVAMFDELSSEDEKKKWLFKENVRLQELSRNLEDERKLIEIQMGMLQRQQSKNMLLKKQLESQKDLFEQKGPLLYLIYGIGYFIENDGFIGVLCLIKFLKVSLFLKSYNLFKIK